MWPQEHSVLPVLYATQWLMTTFACPFPFHFAARVVDLLLASNDSEILLTASMAVMARLAPALLATDDFEGLVRTLKMTPVDWDDATCREVLDMALAVPLSREEAQVGQRQ